MIQLTQNYKSGKLGLLEVPVPSLSKGMILVKNFYSIISPGTEGKSVKSAKLGYIAKAKQKPKEARLVLDSIKEKGLVSTYKTVMNRLDNPVPLGYSCAGEVIGIGREVSDLSVGDFVACAGGNAAHAEVVSVQKNLCARIPKGVDVKYAAFSTIGAISLQGIRQADLTLGGNCVVIGLGLIGQLTMQLLDVSGILAMGIDVDTYKVEKARELGARFVLKRENPSLENIIMDLTNGNGTDAVIITAATGSLDPVELAGTLCRKKGKVIIVGNVPTGFSRENYYKKELDLRMSCSYGPGRYDVQYEEKGFDYPIGYVRWTEKRNMEAFLDILKNKKININSIITHIFEFRNAPEAYNMILKKEEPYIGVVLKYKNRNPRKEIIKFRRKKEHLPEIPKIGLIGAGSFAQNTLLPAFRKDDLLIGIADAKGSIARHIADKYQFDYCTCNSEELIKDDKINTVFIATRHDLHADFVLKALKEEKNVYVEKPLCMKLEELEEIKKEYEKRKQYLMVGFNRRFSPYIQKLKEIFQDDLPKGINYRINASILPSNHWIHDKDIGGGRIIGEVCHFVDLSMFISGSRIDRVSAILMKDLKILEDTVVINLGFQNGSVSSISYFSNGNKRLGKEYLEVFSEGQVVVIDDFKKMNVFSRKKLKLRQKKQDKGHRQEVSRFLDAIKNSNPSPISFEDIYLSTLATFKIVESIRYNKTISL